MRSVKRPTGFTGEVSRLAPGRLEGRSTAQMHVRLRAGDSRSASDPSALRRSTKSSSQFTVIHPRVPVLRHYAEEEQIEFVQCVRARRWTAFSTYAHTLGSPLYCCSSRKVITRVA